jgi:hypothetical protein
MVVKYSSVRLVTLLVIRLLILFFLFLFLHANDFQVLLL